MSGNEYGPQAWLARSLASKSPEQPRDSPVAPFNVTSPTNRGSILPLPSGAASKIQSDVKDSTLNNSSQPNLKFLNRRKKNAGDSVDGTSMPPDIYADTIAQAYANTAPTTSTGRRTSLVFHNNPAYVSNPTTITINGTQVSSNPVANAKGLATASDKLRKLTIEMHHLKEERDILVRDKNIWLKKIKDDNVRLTLLLQDIRSIKSRVLQKIEKFGLGDDGEGDEMRDEISEGSPRARRQPKVVDLNMKLDVEPQYRFERDGTMTENTKVNNRKDISELTAEEIIALIPKVDLNHIQGRSIHDQWDEEYLSLDISVKEVLWDLLLSHITTFVRGHPLSQGLDPLVIREIVQEISTQVRSLLGKAVQGLIANGSILVPVLDDDLTDDTGSQNQSTASKDQTTKTELEEMIMKLLHSSTVHNEIAGEVTMTLTYLYTMNPRPLPQTSEDTTLPLPSPSLASLSVPKPNTEYTPVPIVKPMVLEPKQFRPSSPGMAPPASKFRRNLVIDQVEDDMQSSSPSKQDLDRDSVHTLQPSPRPSTPSSTPRYMQPVRMASTSPTASRSSSRSKYNPSSTSDNSHPRPTTPNSVSSGPTFRPSMSSNQLLSVTLANGAKQASNSQGTSSTLNNKSQGTGSKLNGRTLNIDTEMRYDDSYSPSNDSDGFQTLRQTPTTPTPKSVPRYMQPKNARTSANK